MVIIHRANGPIASVGPFTMSIRIKFFLILLAFSLIPLLVITISSRQSITRLGDDLSEKARSHLMDTVSRELTQSARVSADAISHDVASLQLSLRYLATTTAKALSTPAPVRLKNDVIYTLKDFKQPETAPSESGSASATSSNR